MLTWAHEEIKLAEERKREYLSGQDASAADADPPVLRVDAGAS